MEKETVLILLLLKPMTKTSQLDDIAIMIYHGGYPVLKISIPHNEPHRLSNQKNFVYQAEIGDF